MSDHEYDYENELIEDNMSENEFSLTSNIKYI